MGSPTYGSEAYWAKVGRDAALKKAKRTTAFVKKPRVRALLNATRRASAAAQKSLEARLQRAEAVQKNMEVRLKRADARNAALNASLTKRDQELTASELSARSASRLLQQERAGRMQAEGELKGCRRCVSAWSSFWARIEQNVNQPVILDIVRRAGNRPSKLTRGMEYG
jgi:hypothetical protein